MKKARLTSQYRKSLRKAVNYLHRSDWEVGFFNNEIFYGEGGWSGAMATDQLMPFVEDFNHIEADNIITYELNEKGLDLVDFEFQRTGKTSFETKLTNKASNPSVDGEEYELYVTALRPEKISKHLSGKQTHKFTISMASTDLANDQHSTFSGILDTKEGIIYLNGLTQQRQYGLTSSKDIMLVNSDLF